MTSVIISGIILYLPVLSMDISSNIIVQILSAALIVLDDLIILWGQKFLEVDYLGIDLLPEDDKHAKKLEEYKAYESGKGASCVNSYGSYTGVSQCIFTVY